MNQTGIVYENTILEALGINAVEMGADLVVMELEIGPRVHQPMGILHGGASAVIAESAASMGAYMNCGPDQYSVGVELNISHLRPKTEGRLRARAQPIRKGRSLHVWAVDLTDENDDLVAVARCTIAIRSMDAGKG